MTEDELRAAYEAAGGVPFMNREYFLGLACNTAHKLRVSEIRLEQLMGMRRGALGRYEAGIEALEPGAERLLEMLFRWEGFV